VARIFLSYARADETQVRGVYRRLLDAGFEVWMDKINLLPGQRWEQEIPRAIRNSDFILIFFSKNSVARRGYIQREFRLALETLQEMPADAIHTIPIRLDDWVEPNKGTKSFIGASEFHRTLWLSSFRARLTLEHWEYGARLNPAASRRRNRTHHVN
jgi:hypothetical protein